MRVSSRVSSPGVAGDASRRASAFPIALLGLLLAARVSSVLAFGQGGQVPFTVVLFVLPLLYAVPGTRPLLVGYRWLVLAVQPDRRYRSFTSSRAAA